MKNYNPSKKNILFMAQLPPPVHGAALRNLSLLESGLINGDFNLIPLPLKFIDSMTDLGKFSVKKILLMLKYCFSLLRTLITRRIDLVYFTMSPAGGSFYRDILFMCIIKLFRKKRILHFRVKGIKATASTSRGRRLVRFAFSESEVICLSRHHVLDMDGLLYKPPYIVPNGIKIETAARLPVKKDNGVPAVLFLSNLAVKKGVPELIEALSLVKKEGRKFSASLVGNEWDMSFDDVKELIKSADLLAEVEITGPKFGNEKLDFFKNADIFVFPTYFELFPGVILEAMQFGKAIVSTFEGSIPEMIDDGINGLLVGQRNSRQLADAIAFMIDHPERREEMAQLAQDKFFEGFTLEMFEKKMNAVFHEILSQ